MNAQRRIQLGFLLVAVVPVVLGLFADRTARIAVEASVGVARTNELVKRLEKLLSTLKDVEVAQREFVLTGDETRIADITRLRAEAREGVSQLADIGADRHWLELLRTLIPQKFEEIDRTVGLRRSGDFIAASQEVLRNRGDKAMDDIRTVVRNMIAEENRTLADRSAKQTASYDVTLQIIGWVLLLNLALIASLFWATTRAAEELEKRVADRTRELQRSNEDLARFAYVASHDIKEPMRMISSYASLIQRRYQGKLEKDADTWIGFMVEGVRRMNGMIAGLLDYSRAGEGSGETAEVDVQRVFSEVLHNLQLAVEETGAVVTAEGLPTVTYDPVGMSQLLQNLIANAIKYRSPDRAPRIHVSARASSQETVFAVADNGQGIPPDQRESIFGIFKRLHGKEVEGTGLGLATCRRIAERNGGRIWVESEPGHGSTFLFTVPGKKATRR